MRERSSGFEPGADCGEYGQLVPGPPWILGHRGAPREAPENTLVSLERALDLGLDGVEYDVHACASGEPVLIHDDTLERTTTGRGAISLLTLPELAGIDAGSWFDKRFTGEPLPLLEEALELAGRGGGAPADAPLHMIELKEPSLVGEVARQLAERPRPVPVRIASFHRRVCVEARDLGLPAMLLGHGAEEDDLAFARDERLHAFGSAAGGWRTAAGNKAWELERWSWSVDEPDDLVAACRAPLFGFNTNEPRRALATRAFVALAPEDDGPYPLSVPPLEVPVAAEDASPGFHGEWSGRWEVEVRVRNPFPYEVRVALAFAVRGGAFEVDGFPIQVRLGPGGDARVPLRLSGGSWSPGGDPVLLARYHWGRGPGRVASSLQFDHAVARIRTLRLGGTAVRIPMLRERPGEPFASMNVWREGARILARIEHAGGADRTRAILRVGERTWRGGVGVRAVLPASLDLDDARSRERGVAFSVGFEGFDDAGRRVLRRWAGGLPEGLRAGAPGRLVLDAEG